MSVLVQLLPWTFSEVSKQCVVRGLTWSHNWPTTGDKAPHLRSIFLHLHQQWWEISKLYEASVSWGNFAHAPTCFQRWKKQFVWGFVLSTFVQVWLWWDELYKLLVWIAAITILQLDTETADGWLDKKQPMPSRANISLCKWCLLTKIFLVKICVSDLNLEAPWEPGILLP